MLDKQEKRRGKEHKVINRLAVNRAAAYISLGNINKAKEYLDGIETSYLSEKDGSFLVYTINLIICHYELGELEKAEILYETNLIKLCPIGKRLQKSVEILIGERYYFLGKYDLCYEHLSKLKNCDLDKRQYLSILYRLSQIDILRGDIEQAVIKLNKIKKFGNKLGIVKSSRDILDNLKLQA
jgi:tetratricopeptide (TPR) repeat protein